MGYATVATPAAGAVFALDNYFNSTSTDPLETPVPKNGLALPTANWGQGLRAWRRLRTNEKESGRGDRI